jgi:hypothetical protein
VGKLAGGEDARKAAASVPGMGVAATGGRFEGWTERRDDCQNMSIAISKSVILGEPDLSEKGAIQQILLKTLSLLPMGI